VTGDGCTSFQWLHDLIYGIRSCCDIHDNGGSDGALLDCILGLTPGWSAFFVGIGVSIMLLFRPVYEWRKGERQWPWLPKLEALMSGNDYYGSDAMITSRIVSFIGGHEGFVSTYYLDPAGVGTIGYGFTWGSRAFREWWTAKYGRKFQRGDTITQAEAVEVLLRLLEAEYYPPVAREFASLPLNVKEAGTSAVYNLGAGSLKWQWAKAIASGSIATGAALWRKMGTTARGKRLPGLVRRRNEEADIAEFDRWPGWVKADNSAPETHTSDADVKQAQLWLVALGYQLGRADGIVGPRTRQATEAFQRDHGALRVDGIIGPATLSALQRAIDLKSKAKVVAGSGTAVSATGVAENTTGAADGIATPVGDAGGIGDILMWGGLAVIVVGLAYLAWRYRDEISIALRKL